jgi:hypothetical protein
MIAPKCGATSGCASRRRRSRRRRSPRTPSRCHGRSYPRRGQLPWASVPHGRPVTPPGLRRDDSILQPVRPCAAGPIGRWAGNWHSSCSHLESWTSGRWGEGLIQEIGPLGQATTQRWEIDTSRSTLTFSLRHIVIQRIRGRFDRWGDPSSTGVIPAVERQRLIDLASIPRMIRSGRLVRSMSFWMWRGPRAELEHRRQPPGVEVVIEDCWICTASCTT